MPIAVRRSQALPPSTDGSDPQRLAYARCPTCGLRLRVRSSVLVPEYCPRCIARRSDAVPLMSYVPDPTSPKAGRAHRSS